MSLADKVKALSEQALNEAWTKDQIIQALHTFLKEEYPNAKDVEIHQNPQKVFGAFTKYGENKDIFKDSPIAISFRHWTDGYWVLAYSKKRNRLFAYHLDFRQTKSFDVDDYLY